MQMPGCCRISLLITHTKTQHKHIIIQQQIQFAQKDVKEP